MLFVHKVRRSNQILCTEQIISHHLLMQQKIQPLRGRTSQLLCVELAATYTSKPLAFPSLDDTHRTHQGVFFPFVANHRLSGILLALGHTPRSRAARALVRPRIGWIPLNRTGEDQR